MQDYSISPSGKIRYIEVDHGYDTPCWDWQMHRNHKGYARWRVNGRNNPSHRLYYEHYKGPIPEGHHIDHLCRNRACVNPDHLEPVTPAENIRRGNGTRLTPDQVEEIMSFKGKMTGAEVGEAFGVSRQHINRIWRGDRWRKDDGDVVSVRKLSAKTRQNPPDSRIDSRMSVDEAAKTPAKSSNSKSYGARGGTVTAGN